MIKTLIIAAVDDGSSDPLATIIGAMAFGAYVYGVIRLFMGRNTTLAVFAVFTPFLFVAGYFAQPRPGSALYLRSKPATQVAADRRYPAEALEYRRLLIDIARLDAMKDDIQYPTLEKARQEIESHVPNPFPSDTQEGE